MDKIKLKNAKNKKIKNHLGPHTTFFHCMTFNVGPPKKLRPNDKKIIIVKKYIESKIYTVGSY